MAKIICIHGNSQSSKIWDNLNLCDVAVSLPGHDGTPLDKPFCVSTLVELIAGIAGDDEVILIGQSLGGHICYQVADKINTKAIITLDSPPLTPESFATAFAPIEAMNYIYKPDLSEDELNTMARTFTCTEKGFNQMKEYIINTDGKARSDLLESIMRGEVRNEVEILRSLDIPILLIHSTINPVINSEYMKSLKIGEYIELNGSHSVIVEQPELYNKVVESFLEKNKLI